MPLDARIVLGVSIALAAAYIATPVAGRVAARLDFYDHPAGGYKDHRHPTPYLGGAAVICGFLTALLLMAGDERTLPIAALTTAMWVVGTVDDRRSVRPLVRMLGEAAAGAALWAFGLGWHLGLGGFVDLLATMCWVVGIVNAFNIFDNMDAVATTMAVVIAGALALFGAVEGDAELGLTAAALCGACAGFLPHNSTSPARIFLGDGGSMVLGFALAALSILAVDGRAPAWQGLGLALLLLAIPILDMLLRIRARWRLGRPIMVGGRDGLAHWSRRQLHEAVEVAFALGAAQAVVSAMVIVALGQGSGAALAVVGLGLVLAGVALARFDVRERAPEQLRSTAIVLPHPLGFAAPLLAVAAALSPLARGYYDARVWSIAGLVAVPLLVLVLMARPPELGRSAFAILAAFAALAAWALASAAWADSAGLASLDGNRLVVYAVLLAVLVALVRDRRTAVVPLACFGLAAAGLIVWELAALAGDAAPARFLAGRLDDPLDYINGQACFYAMVLWPAVALAEHRRWWLAGPGVAFAVLAAGLVLFTQSRGAAFALLVALGAIFAVVPGRLRRAWVLLTVAAALLLAGPTILDVYASRDATQAVPAGAVHRAVGALVLAALGAGAAWALASAIVEGQGPRARARMRLVAVAALCALALAVLSAAAPQSRPIAGWAHRQYDAFVHLSLDQGGEATSSRLLSGAGYRYDYWRVAVHSWREHPVAGVGAGNYAASWFAARSTPEDIRQPHSLPLQVASELGVVGTLLVLALIAGGAVAMWRCRGPARDDPTERMLLVSASGLLVVWFAHAGVDWVHLLPGLTAGALLGLAVLLRPGAPGEAGPAPQFRNGRQRPRALVVTGLVSLLLVVAGLSLSRQWLADHYRGEAQAALPDRPRAAIASADRALRLDSQTLQAYYTKAAAYARLGDGDRAAAVLREAREREPHNFLPPALLGDLALRRGRTAEALGHYRRALRLNPREPSLLESVAELEGRTP